jgi:ribosomal-protein-alanine N-acetyltransferase
MNTPNLNLGSCTLRLPEIEDAANIVAYQVRNRAHFKSFEPVRPDFYFTESFWKVEATNVNRGFHAGQYMRFFLFDESERTVGSTSFLLFTYGNAQSCVLAYNLDYECWGRGIMYSALQIAIQFVFDTFKIRRIQANYIPENGRSGRLLERLGFEKEGLAKEYLEIDGQWRDHVLTSKLNPLRSLPS